MTDNSSTNPHVINFVARFSGPLLACDAYLWGKLFAKGIQKKDLGERLLVVTMQAYRGE